VVDAQGDTLISAPSHPEKSGMASFGDSAMICSLCPCARGVTSLAYAEDAGSAGMLYSVGRDGHVCALDASTGAQVLRFKAGRHPLACIGAAPGALT
jgi:hypothetical protein